MTTDCSKIAVTESAETTVHHYLSIVHPGMGRQQTSLWSSARRCQFVHRPFRSSVYGASSKLQDLSHCPLADQLCRNAVVHSWRRRVASLLAPSSSEEGRHVPADGSESISCFISTPLMVLRRVAVSVSIAMHYQYLRFVPDVCVVCEVCCTRRCLLTN